MARPRPLDVLVTDAQSRAGVAGIRALGAAGRRVVALAEERGGPGLWSRHAALRAVGPSPAEGRAFVERIGELAVEHGPLVVLPGQEQALDPLCEHGDMLPDEAILPYPSLASVRTLRHKPSLEALVGPAGLAVPETLAEGPAGALAADPPQAPCVVKSPGLSRALTVARVVETREELLALLGRLPEDEPVLIQERATGPLIGLALVLDRDGEVVASFQQEATLLWPLAAGGSRRATSVAPDDALVQAAARLLRAAGFWGFAQMQFLTARRGPAIIDVNPRLYGSLPLATAAGINLPAVWHAVALGEPVGDTSYRAGVSYRWLEGELAAAAKGAWRELLRRPPAPRSGAMWAADDPLPSTLLALGSAWRRTGRKLAIAR